MLTNSAAGSLPGILNHHAITHRTWLGNWALPICPFTIGVITAPEEQTAALGPLFDQVSSTIGAGYAYFDQYLFGVATAGIVAAANKASKATLANNQRVTAQWAVSADKFRLFSQFYFG